MTSTLEIADRLGISSAVFQKRVLGAREIAQIREAGIRYLEISSLPHSFDYRNRSQVSEVQAECARQGVQIASFHTALYPFGSEHEPERKAAVKEAFYLAEIAVEMGANVLSVHLGANDPSRASMAEMLEALEGAPLTLAVENVGQVSIQDALSLVDEIGSDRFQMVLDIGHERDADGVNPFVQAEKARAAVAQCAGALCGVHLHETFALERRADHRAPLHEQGLIEWGEVLAGLHAIDYRGPLTFEDGRGENPEQWVQAVGQFPQAFFERYRDA